LKRLPIIISESFFNLSFSRGLINYVIPDYLDLRVGVRFEIVLCLILEISKMITTPNSK